MTTHTPPTLLIRVPTILRGLRRDQWATVALAALWVVLRLAWIATTNWREDPAATLWLGAMQHPFERPVGLLSSTTFPNANGMTFIGSVLALAPGLYGSSLLLAVIQALLLGWLCLEVCPAQPRAAWLAAVALTCEPAVACLGTEFWNQYTVGLLDVAFVASSARFCRAPSWRYLPLWAFLALMAPGLYLAGLANALVYTLMAVLLVTLHWRTLRGQAFLPHAVRAVAVGTLVGIGVWMPFVLGVNLASLSHLSARSASESLHLAATALWIAPVCAVPTAQWALMSLPPCAGDFPWRGTLWLRTAWLTAAGAVLAFGGAAAILRLTLAVVRRRSAAPAPDGHPRAPASGIALCFGFAWLSLVISPLVGGPALVDGERPDHVVRLLPLLMVGAIAAAARPGRDLGLLQRPFRVAGAGLIAVYILLAAGTGAVLVTRHLTYRGNELTGADVPLLDKLRVVRFIAREWQTRGDSGNPSIGYQLTGQRWDFVPVWGAMMRHWYPGDVYTVGRCFDYELRHAHGLKNAQEGHGRTARGAHYIVSYAHEPAPEPPHGKPRHTLIGRLRVSVMEPPPHNALPGRADR
jgi:hypothetical protein